MACPDGGAGGILLWDGLLGLKSECHLQQEMRPFVLAVAAAGLLGMELP
jgi:hypothetical protein